MRRVYIAALYSRMHEICDYVDKLEQAGHTNTARWIKGDEEGQSRQAAALMDIADLDFCDVVMSFSEPKGTYTKGGGRHFEFGYGYATKKRLMIVGNFGEHVFHYLPNVEYYSTFEEALEALNKVPLNAKSDRDGVQ